jgi:hypothetical protein
MNHEFALAIITAAGSTGGWGIVSLWLASRQKKSQDERDAKAKEAQDKRDAEAKANEDRRAKQAEDSQTWYRESRHHYDVANQETAAAREECKECRRELEHTRRVIYTMFEELEDQIIPMLSEPGEINPAQIRAASREVIKKARESLRAAPI